jgi:hypothetical protein
MAFSIGNAWRRASSIWASLKNEGKLMASRSKNETPSTGLAPTTLVMAMLSLATFSSTAQAAIPPNNLIPDAFTGVWVEQPLYCSQLDTQPSFTLMPFGFVGLVGEKIHPNVKKLDRAGRHIRVSFYNSMGSLFWRSTEYFRLSADGNSLRYRFADRTVNWVRCPTPTPVPPTIGNGTQ